MSGDQAYLSENLVYYLGRFAANKVNFTWFVTLILGMDASNFRWVKGACSVIPFKGACVLKQGAPFKRGNRVIKLKISAKIVSSMKTII